MIIKEKNMKNIPFFLFFILLFISCSIGPLPIYYSQPVIGLIEDTVEVLFLVPDVDNSGWNRYNNQSNTGADTIFISPSAFEKTGLKSYIESIEYQFIVDNKIIENKKSDYLIPITIEDKDTVSLPELMVIVDEPLAYEIDLEDGYADNVGSGIIQVIVYYSDLNGNDYTIVPIRKRFKVLKPV